MDDERIYDIKSEIEMYMNLDYKIEALQQKKKNYSRYYYSMFSLVSGMGMDDSISDVYQSAPPVEQIAIHIVTIEQLMQERLERLIEKNRLFKQVLDDIDKGKVMHALRQTELTLLETIVFDAIQEVEFYIDGHQKAKDRQQFNEIASADIEFVECEQNVLSRMEGLLNG